MRWQHLRHPAHNVGGAVAGHDVSVIRSRESRFSELHFQVNGKQAMLQHSFPKRCNQLERKGLHSQSTAASGRYDAPRKLPRANVVGCTDVRKMQRDTGEAAYLNQNIGRRAFECYHTRLCYCYSCIITIKSSRTVSRTQCEVLPLLRHLVILCENVGWSE